MNSFFLKFKHHQNISDYTGSEPTAERKNIFNMAPITKKYSLVERENDRSSKQLTSDYKAFRLKYRINEQQFPIIKLFKLQYPLSYVTNDHLAKLDFSPLCYPVKELILYAKSMIESSPERKIIGWSFNLHRLIQLIASNYNVNAYHNFTHAFSVLLLLFQSYNLSEKLQKCLTQKQWFYIFIAALIHDINHPGNTNTFQRNSRSKCAVEADYQSILEKMHLNHFWKILKSNSQINFLQGYSNGQSNNIKKLITRMVLATDFVRHESGLESLKMPSKYRKSKGEYTMVVIEQLFHACDIGNSCSNFQHYLNWSILVNFQFNQQALREKQMGLPLTDYLKYENKGIFYKNQLHFCRSIVLPLWKELANIFEEFEEMVDNIENNIVELRKRAQQQIK